MMSQTTTEPRQTDRRRAEIAAAARSLIAEQGFEGLRTRDIAERVGINIATMHYHVPSKEALVELVAQSLRDEFRAQYARHSREGLSAIEEIRLEFADFRETLTDNREAFIVLAELSARARRDEKVAAIMEPLKIFWHHSGCGLFCWGGVCWPPSVGGVAPTETSVPTSIRPRQHAW